MSNSDNIRRELTNLQRQKDRLWDEIADLRRRLRNAGDETESRYVYEIRSNEIEIEKIEREIGYLHSKM